MNVYAILSFVSFLLFFQAIFISWFLIKLPRIRIAFFFFALSFAIFALANFFQLSTTTPELVYKFDRFGSLGWLSFPITTLWLLYTINQKEVKGIKNLILFFLCPVALVTFIRFQIDPYTLKQFYFEDGIRFYTLNSTSPWYYIFFVYLVVSAIACLYTILTWKKSMLQNRQKLQANIIFGGLFAFVVLSIITNLILPQFEVNSIGPLAHINILPFAVALFYALTFLGPNALIPEFVPKLIASYLSEFVFYFDHRGKLYSVNRYVLENLHYNQYEILRVPPEKIFKNSDIIRQMTENFRFLHTLPEVPLGLYAKGGELIPVFAKMVRINDYGGNFIGSVIIGEDLRLEINLQEEISQRTQNEKILSQTRKDLELLVETRTRELYDANVRLGNEILEKTRAEQQIVADLEEKALLVKEIHHRVKNNIQIIVSLANMLITHKDIDEPARAKLRKIADRIRSISAIHEDLYSSSNLSKVNFNDFLKRATTEIYASKGAGKNIIFRLKAMNEFLEIDKAIPCAIIFTELLTNIVEHSFQPASEQNSGATKAGTVNIEFNKHLSEYTLMLSDHGEDSANGKTFLGNNASGLELVDLIVKNHLKGHLEIQVSPGITYILKFSD